MINWIYLPQSRKPGKLVTEIIAVFERHADEIDSQTHDRQVSDAVLAKARDQVLYFNIHS